MTAKPTLTNAIAIVSKGGGDGNDFLRLKISRNGESTRCAILSIDSFIQEPKATIRALKLPLASAQAQREFEKRVQDKLDLEVSFRVAVKSSWCGNAFVDPNGVVIGDGDFEVCLPNFFSKYGHKFRDGGTVSGWSALAKYARGNSRLMLALALAFVGPIGRFLQVEQVMIQLVGPPGSGKSTVATVAGSVWGCSNDLDRPQFCETWNNTINKLDEVGAAHDGTFMVLDETKNVDRSGGRKRFDVIADAILRLHEGSVKGRHTDVGVPATSWRGLLSTSNLSLDQMAQADGCEIDDAHRTRLIDIPALAGEKYGVYEDLHGFQDHATFSAELLKLARTHFGVASVLYIEGIIDWRKRDDKGFTQWLKHRRSRYLAVAKTRLLSKTRDLSRLHGKFATIYAAGALAIKLGILPWTKPDLFQALLECQRAHIDMVAGSVTTAAGIMPAQSDAKARLEDHIRLHRSTFVDLRQGAMQKGSHKHTACRGYINRQKGGPLEYLFSEKTLLAICGSKAELLRLKKRLQIEDILIKDASRPSTRRTIWADGTREQVIAIRADAFSDQ